MIKAPEAQVSEAISKTNRRFEKAMSDASPEDVLAVYTSNGSIMPPNSPIITGGEQIKAFWKGGMEMGIANAELTTVELDDHGDTVNEVGKFKLSAKDGSTIDTGKFIVIWKKENGEWLWHHDIWSSENAA